jgi:SWI/SNF-related matrix-associated actin-dependent regulator of chromatin subfamily A-like protein 1
MIELYPYQKDGVAYLKANRNALLYDDPGLGKTAQSLCALPDSAAAIVICPASVKSVWVKEAKKFTSLTPIVIEGRNIFRLPKQGELIIINPEILPDVITGGSFVYNLIVDEVHMFKSTTTVRSRKLRALRNYVLGENGSIWGLTGTPLMTRPSDLWGVLTSLGLEHKVYGTYDRFLRAFNGRRVQWRTFSNMVWGTPKPEAGEALKKVCLGRDREKVLPDLPTKTYETYEVDINVPNSYEFLKEPGELSKMTKEVAQAKAFAALPFLETLAESEPLVIFTTHVDAAKQVADRFSTKAIDGSCPNDTRAKLVEDFQEGNTNIIVGTIGAMGVGLTLTRANRVIFLSRDWTPALNTQAEDRVCRIGQTKPVIVTDIVGSTLVEKLLAKVLEKKDNYIENSVEMAR